MGLLPVTWAGLFFVAGLKLIFEIYFGRRDISLNHKRIINS